jgi:hypothetical protein
MELTSFMYEGKEYLISEVIDLGNERYQVSTTDQNNFILQYNKIVCQWVVIECKSN